MEDIKSIIYYCFEYEEDVAKIVSEMFRGNEDKKWKIDSVIRKAVRFLNRNQSGFVYSKLIDDHIEHLAQKIIDLYEDWEPITSYERSRQSFFTLH